MDRARLISIVRTALPVWLVALVIVGSCEILTRYGLGDDARWQYWNRTMAIKVELVQRLGASANPPDLLFVGDSSAAFNIQPAIVDGITGTHSYNLGSAGNYASSFDITMTRGVLPELGFVPKAMLVSFAGHGFDPDHLGQTETVISSPLGRRERGLRVWGDGIHLVRLHHLLRLWRDPPVNPSVRREAGFEPYQQALDRRRRRPGLARQLPQAPAWMVTTQRKQTQIATDPMEPVRNLFRWCADQGIGVVLVSPPSDQKRWVPQLDAVAAEFGVAHWDYSAAPFKQHLSHMTLEVSKRYSRQLGQRLKEEGWTVPHR